MRSDYSIWNNIADKDNRVRSEKVGAGYMCFDRYMAEVTNLTISLGKQELSQAAYDAALVALQWGYKEEVSRSSRI